MGRCRVLGVRVLMMKALVQNGSLFQQFFLKDREVRAIRELVCALNARARTPPLRRACTYAGSEPWGDWKSIAGYIGT